MHMYILGWPFTVNFCSSYKGLARRTRLSLVASSYRCSPSPALSAQPSILFAGDAFHFSSVAALRVDYLYVVYPFTMPQSCPFCCN